MARKINILRLSLFAGALLCLLALIVFLAVRCASGPGGASGGVDLSQTQLIAGQTALPFKDGYLTSNGVYIRAYSASDALLWEYAPDSSDVQYTASDSLVALWKDTGLYVLDAGGTVLSSSLMEGKIASVRCGVSQIAVHLEDSDSVLIRAKDGTPVDTLSLEGLTVLDFGLYTSDDLCWVMALDDSGTIPVSYVNTYQPGKLSTGSHAFSDQVVYKALFHGSTSYMVTSRYVRVSSDAESETLVYGWQFLASAQTDGGYALVFTRNSQIASPSELKVLLGGDEFDLRLSEGCLGVVAGQKYIYGIAPDAVYRIAYREGATATRFPLSEGTALSGVVAGLKNGRALVRDQSVVYRLTLP